MNILYIFHYAGSPEYGMSFRPYYMAREWVRQGHNVTIIASSFSHLRQKNPFVTRDFQEETVDGIKYVWMKGNEYGGAIARIKNIASFVWKLQRNARRIAKEYRPDLVIASSTYPLDNVPANKIAKIAGAKHCYEAHDIWPLSPMVIGGYSKWHPFILVMQWAESFACRKADKVISLLWNSEKHYRECGLKPGNFACVPNGFAADEWDPKASEQPLPEEHEKVFASLKDKVVVGFAGGFAASGALTNLIESAKLLREHQELAFVLVGKGPEKENYLKLIQQYGLTNFYVLPAVPKKLVPAVNAHFDIAYIGGVHSVLHKYGTSANKLTDYMLAGKPIIQAIDEPGSVVERVGCGIQVEAENPELTAQAIEKLYFISEDEREEMGLKGRNYTVENLEWGKLAESFLKIMEQ